MAEGQFSGNGSGITAPPGAPALPPLYKNPFLLDANRHAHLSLKQNGGYAFARTAQAMLLNTVEFALAARNYPIIFVGTDTVVPLVVLGVREGQNLFVRESGEWAPGHYVPAYARRYPFLFAEIAQGGQLGLCLEDDPDWVVSSDVRPLFKSGRRTEVVERALEFCAAYQREFEATKAYTAALVEHDLLIANQADLRLNTGERLAVGGFRVIDENRFNKLPDSVFLDWRKKGWVAFTYCHLVSVTSWTDLLDRAFEARPATLSA